MSETIYYREDTNTYYPSIDEAVETAEIGDVVFLEPFQSLPGIHVACTEDGFTIREEP